MNDEDLFGEIIRLKKKSTPFALATVVESSGSSPRKAGAKMLVKSDGAIMGTIGGGIAESEVVSAAVAAIRDGKPKTISLKLTEKYGHVCGGKILVFIEPSRPANRLLIFGAGHVGQALARAAKFIGLTVIVSDERSHYAGKERLTDVDEIHIGESREILAALAAGPNDFIVIATPSHESDFAAARAALRTNAGYIGVIGSRRKREILMMTLENEGFTKSNLARLIIPVGLPIGAESPEEIAVSIVSQLIEKRSLHGDQNVGDSSGRGKFAANGNAEAVSAGS